MQELSDVFRQILDTNAPLLFHLHLLRLIELIRYEKIDEALEFATNELAPRGAQNPEFLGDLERTMGLLAFPDLARFADDSMSPLPARPPPDAATLELFQDPAFIPITQLMRRGQRVRVAKELNAAILESQGEGMETKMSGLVRLMAWGEEKLEKAGVGLPISEKDRGRQWADVVLQGEVGY